MSDCPVGCGRKVHVGHLMCRPCWSQVPRDLQQAVYRTWRAWRGGLDHEKAAAYRQAREAAIASVP